MDIKFCFITEANDEADSTGENGASSEANKTQQSTPDSTPSKKVQIHHTSDVS